MELAGKREETYILSGELHGPSSSSAISTVDGSPLGRVEPPELHLHADDRESLLRDPEPRIFSVESPSL